MDKESINAYMWRFLEDVNSIYEVNYLNRKRTKGEMDRMECGYTNSGFPGCVGAVDVTKFVWKTAPIPTKGISKRAKKIRWILSGWNVV